jgi:ribosomal protein S18 acetylase RimI-like enzyme
MERLRAAGDGAARVLLVETSSTPQYDGARGFYRAHGFVEEAPIREFRGPGDDKIVFWRAVSGDPGDLGGARDPVSGRAPRASA